MAMAAAAEPYDVNGLQQQDDAEYGDEDMPPQNQMQVSNALAEQRATKKRAQDDVKLLANRIALLKLEEKKVSALTFGQDSHADYLSREIVSLFLFNCKIGLEEN